MGNPRRSPTADEESTATDEPSPGGGGDRPSLLARAGVIGAGSIAEDDRGNPFIPVPVHVAPASPPDADDAAAAWVDSGIPDHEIERWEQVGATPTTAATLRRLGADPEAVDAAPVSADELVGWLWHGFAADEVADWLELGSVRTAVRRRAAGLPPGGDQHGQRS